MGLSTLFSKLIGREAAAPTPEAESPAVENDNETATEPAAEPEAVTEPEVEASAEEAGEGSTPDAGRPGRPRRSRGSTKRGKNNRRKRRGERPRSKRARPRGASAPAVRDGQVVHATDATFRKLVLESEQPVLVDFWAEWCGPCKAMGPTIDELAREFSGQARLVKVDVDACPRTAAQFGIRSIPTLALFKEGELADTLVGLQTKGKLAKVLKKAA